MRQVAPAACVICLILAGRAAAIAAPRMAAIVADELQSVEIAVVTAAGGTFEFHTSII